jgi:thioredoxin 1
MTHEQCMANSGKKHTLCLNFPLCPLIFEKLKNPYFYNVEEETFEELVVARSHETPVLVDISAEWCAPCRVLAPLLHKLVVDYDGSFLLGLVDADENMKIAGRHKARGFPTVVAYSHGKEIDRFHSAQTESFLRRFIDSVIERHASNVHEK